MEDDQTKVFLKVWLIILSSLSYCYFIASKFPKLSKFRIFFFLPIISLFIFLPLCLSSTLPTGLTSFFITWLANFKLILLCFNLGPLSNIKSLTKFILLAAFPIKIMDSTTPNQNPKKPKIIPLNFWSKTLIFSILVAICDIYKGTLHQGLLFGIYCCMLYLFIDIVLNLCNALVGPIMGLELCPPSDEPYVASSLQDFWGRRWNLMVTDTLRHTVYKPVKLALYKYEWAPAMGVLVTFLVSGLMHELIFYYMTRVSPSWEVTCFFVLHGLCVTIEVALKRSLGRRVRLHWALTGPLAVGFVIGTGYWLFFPPLVRNQADVRAIEESKELYKIVKAIFKQE